jgi:hypothetical protein
MVIISLTKTLMLMMEMLLMMGLNDDAVVLARLIIDKRDYGMHSFMVQVRPRHIQTTTAHSLTKSRKSPMLAAASEPQGPPAAAWGHSRGHRSQGELSKAPRLSFSRLL